MATTASKMSVDEFLVYAASHGRCELIDGEVRHMSPAGGNHGNIAGVIHGLIFAFVRAHKVGKVFAAETGFILDREGPRVRAPDVAFVRAENAGRASVPGFIPIAPDLVVEVLSPDDRASEVHAKIQDWLAFGVRLAWVVDPETKTIIAHQGGGRSQTYTESDELPGEPAIAGLRLSVREIFA